MLFRFLLFAFFITVIECLTGVEIVKSDENCIISLFQSKFISENETEWIKLDINDKIPCYEIIEKPNSGKFTIATKSDGTVFLTFIVLETSEIKKLKVAYLDPEIRKFGSLKTIIGKPDCLNDKIEVFPYLNFKSDGKGKVKYGDESCLTEINEDEFFDKDKHEIGNAVIKERKKRFSQLAHLSEMSSLLQNSRQQISRIEEPVTEPPSKVEAINEVTNIPTTCTITGKILTCEHNEMPFILPIDVKNPSLFAIGNTTILKLTDRFNYTTPENQQYFIINFEESHIETWPNFVYIFDETAFEKPFFFSKNFENSS
uniref:Uncharacterized protein n=1 Tax=Panagrolaimus davidi TaxID=227884 RepID=A0A914QV95_9BILA